MQPDGLVPPAGPVRKPVAKRPSGALKRVWLRVRTPLAQSSVAKHAIATLLVRALRLIQRTNPLVAGSSDLKSLGDQLSPAIVALWHGQHLLAGCYYTLDRPVCALVSRSADAELNALVLERLGIEAVRGSGGRRKSRDKDKGGATALVALKRALDNGTNVVMIADIVGKPREAGLGIVTLARLSGRPVVPMAVATSRRRILQRSWDKTTINLPFGRGAVVLGEPINVARDADDQELERKRSAVTEGLRLATDRAYRLADGGV